MGHQIFFAYLVFACSDALLSSFSSLFIWYILTFLLPQPIELIPGIITNLAKTLSIPTKPSLKLITADVVPISSIVKLT